MLLFTTEDAEEKLRKKISYFYECD